ncbi:MAG: SMC-Scp complex subunit ScpB [Microthrixaceae bacterium]|nr:SMC-Scp complex subunit ScpB [Microthrixaceae bacterium]
MSTKAERDATGSRLVEGRTETRRAIEAIVMVADEPADPRLLAQLVEVAPEVVEAICEELAAAYEAEERGFELVKVAGGWRFQSHSDLSPYVERFVLSGQSSRLSAAALETLAIIAYKQPISRAQVSAIRGVNVDAVMRTLQQRGYIAELARDPGPGQAVLFGTTSHFLERLGLNGLGELPALGEFVPSVDVLEQLERGLRIDDEGVDVAEDPQTEEVVIDLTDPQPVHLSEPLEALEVLAEDSGDAFDDAPRG